MNPVAVYLALHGLFLCELTPNHFRIKRQLRDFEALITLNREGKWYVSAGANLAAYNICSWDLALDILPSMEDVEKIIAHLDTIDAYNARYKP